MMSLHMYFIQSREKGTSLFNISRKSYKYNCILIILYEYRKILPYKINPAAVDRGWYTTIDAAKSAGV